MFPGINPKKIQEMMRSMGIKQEDIEANRVIIECEDKNIVIEPASVAKVIMQGQETWQITGEAREEEKGKNTGSFGDEDNLEEDIKVIMEKTGCSEKEARKALEETNDIAEAIISLS
jgi:nascent polypeptide-associated complex subunit alpha